MALNSFLERFKAGFRKQAPFERVPNPEGNFVPTSGLSPLQQLEITPYGYLSTGSSPQFLLDSFPNGNKGQYWKVFIQFTSYERPLSPKICFDIGEGFDEAAAIEIPIVNSGRAVLTMQVPESVKRVRLDPAREECIFSFHDFQLLPCTEQDLVELDIAKERKPFDIVCFPIIDWDYRYQRPQQLLSRFAKNGHRVFYVSTCFSGLCPPQVVSRGLAENVTGISLPGNDRLSLYKDEVTENTLEKGVNALIDFLLEHGCSTGVVLVDLPFWIPFAKELKSRLGWKIVYDCMDDHSGFENNTPTMLAAEEDTVASSDLLVTTSDLLQGKYASRHGNSCLIRNAGDLEHFSREISCEDRPLSKLQGPIIGYYGALAEWFDLEAVSLAAKKHPEWSFVLIGHVNDSRLEELDEFENVHFFGEKPYGELPDFVAGFDVCTIPFRRIPLTEATNPVKVYEYLATGKPIVARDLPELESLSNVVSLYKKPEEFVGYLEKALGDTREESRARRREISSLNTWDHRFQALEHQVHKLYKRASIVVVSYQSLGYLRECVASVLANTHYPNFELVIVDNASDSGVVSYLKSLDEYCPNVRVILNSSNRGFAAANNQGLKHAKGSDYFVLLNNDTVVPPGWLSRLLFWASRPDIGIVGPVSNSVGNEAMIPVGYDNIEDMNAFARSLMRYCHGECFDIRVLAMFCMAMRRDVLDKVGYLDQDFGMGMFEDDDYAQRVREAGYRVVCAEDVFVHHYGSVSFSKLSDKRYRDLFEKNREIYEKKWGEWVPHKYRD